MINMTSPGNNVLTNVAKVTFNNTVVTSRHEVFRAIGEPSRNGSTVVDVLMPCGQPAKLVLFHSYGYKTGMQCTMAEIHWNGRRYSFDSCIWIGWTELEDKASRTLARWMKAGSLTIGRRANSTMWVPLEPTSQPYPGDVEYINSMAAYKALRGQTM
jgi:hypothetical protein